MESYPKVSIVIPVFNGSDFLRKAIDSALAQTYGNIEIIVVNDGSTDGGDTEKIALSYGDKVRYFRKPNGGVSSALNHGIREMTGEYFSWLSHDDVYCPEKIEIQIDYLLSTDPKLILYSDYDCIDEQSRHVNSVKVPHLEPREFRGALLYRHPIHGCSALIPKVCLDEAGPFNEKLRVIQDYEMWLRLSRKFDFVHLPQILIHSRLHAGQGSVTMAASHFKEKSSFFKDYFDEIAGESEDAAAVSSLLKAAISLKRASFFEAAAYGYRIARVKMSNKPLMCVRNLHLIANYRLSKSRFSINYWRRAFNARHV